MHEWYDVKVRGVLGSGKRDVHEIQILGRNLTWTEEALLEGLGLNEESKAVNSAAGNQRRLIKKRTRRCWTRQKQKDSGVNADVHVDSNWASGPERKSTSGGMMMINGTVEHWSRTQATRTLSTAEAEYYAVVTGAAEGFGMQSMMADLGVTTQVRV